MRNPNFLILDEPTNDLDIVTLQILEQYLQDFKGCVIVVSHDRYFMDKIVDHILVFKGQGEIQDFPGNYTQYREWKNEFDRRQAEKTKADKESRRGKDNTENNNKQGQQTSRKPKLTFNERKEMASLEADIEALEAEKKMIEEKLSSGKISVDEITELSRRLPKLNEELDVKSMRWLELSEIEG